VEIGIFDLLEEKLFSASTRNLQELLSNLYSLPSEPCIISLNYDLIIDTALMDYSQRYDPEGRFPDYCCDIQTEFYRSAKDRCGTLLKLHGSLNWLYCKTCHRLEIGASESRRFIRILSKLLGQPRAVILEKFYTPQGSPCQTCGSVLRPLLIAPSHLKDYRNPHLAHVWYHAEKVLRQADRAVFIGYSLPDDDVEVVYLFKRCLAHLKPRQITVVEYDQKLPPVNSHAVGRRYRTLFGDDIDWHPEGMDAWRVQ
jgi:hypothetical protein